MVLAEGERTFCKKRRASNRDRDLSAHGPHVWQLNRQHDWLHEGGVSAASPWRIVLVKRELHETTGSYHNRVQGCQTCDIRKEKKSSRSHSIVMTQRVFFPEVFPARMILLFTIKSIVLMFSLAVSFFGSCFIQIGLKMTKTFSVWGVNATYAKDCWFPSLSVYQDKLWIWHKLLPDDMMNRTWLALVKK